jgi:hypothetical protein
MRKIFLPLLILLIVFSITADVYPQIKLNVKASLNNTFRYGSGTEFLNGQNVPKEYLENLSDARLSVNDIVFGMRYEISDPIEFGRDFKGIRKRYVEYTGSDMISVRGGNFYEVIGRGMTLNTFEQRTLAYDTDIDGGRIIFKHTFGEKKPVKIKAEIIGGDIEFVDYPNTDRVETYKIRDANFEISPLKFLTLGGNYVHAKGNIPSGNVVTDMKADIPEAYLNFNYGGFQLFSSYAHKHTITEPNTTYPVSLSANGDAFYSSATYSESGWGVTLEYKNYRFDVTNPNNQSYERPTKMLPFQNPPTVVKEHTSTLISRNPHVVDFNDEVGAQIEINYVPNDNLIFLLNASAASKHYKYEYNSITGEYTRIDRSDDFIPAFDNEFNPFWEVYLESEYYINKKTYAKLALSRQSLTTFTYPNALEQIFTTTIPGEFKYTFIKDMTAKLILEQQWISNSIRTGEKEFMNQFVSLSFIKSPNLTLTLNAEFTNDDEEPSGKKSWIQGEVAYNINTANVVTVSYGSERGGLRCTSGICRYVNPFNGFRLSVQSRF